MTWHVSPEEWLLDFTSVPRGRVRAGESLDAIDDRLRSMLGPLPTAMFMPSITGRTKPPRELSRPVPEARPASEPAASEPAPERSVLEVDLVHKNDPPPPAAPKAAKVAKAKAAAAAPITGGLREWARRMDEFALDHDRIIRAYSMRETFQLGEPVQHPKFGKGVVLEILETNKVAILFEEGRKVLAMNASASAS